MCDQVWRAFWTSWKVQCPHPCKPQLNRAAWKTAPEAFTSEVESVEGYICSWLLLLFWFSPTPLVASEEQGDGQVETPAQQQARMSASSATRELDELMASLSDFKVQSNVSSFHKAVLLLLWLMNVYTDDEDNGWCATVEDCAVDSFKSTLGHGYFI